LSLAQNSLKTNEAAVSEGRKKWQKATDRKTPPLRSAPPHREIRSGCYQEARGLGFDLRGKGLQIQNTS